MEGLNEGLDMDLKPEVLKFLRREYEIAKEKHPYFPCSALQNLAIIMEEVGEVARAINECEGRERVATEAAHVAVTAIRMMERMMEGVEE